MGEIVDLAAWRSARSAPVPTSVSVYGWRLAWVFVLWPVPGFQWVMVPDWG